MLISVEGTGKNQLQPGQESMGDDAVLLHLSLLRSHDQNRPVCWSIVMKKKPTVRSPLFDAFPSAASLRRRRMSMYISLFTAEIPIKYTSESLEFFEATTY